MFETRERKNMRDILAGKAAELAEDIRNSALYADFVNSRRAFMNDKELREKYFYYKALSDRQSSRRHEDFEDEKRLSAMYWELMRSEKAAAYFNSEKRLIDLFKEVYGAIEEVASVILREENVNEKSV
jgi:cell fate (sporulation/competence/biofilm development) regulator YlbF (YheA/YmcA/DUF963 family)